MSIARQLDLDLVEVAPEAQPPVCRIMDYPKFKYDTAQRAKESRRKTTSTSIKEMKYRPKIGQGDFDTKTRQVTRFLGEGHKVKITIMFRGREMSHQELGLKILERVAETVNPIAKVEAAPKVDGRNMIMVLAPDRRAQQAAAKAKAADAAEGETVEQVPATATATDTDQQAVSPVPPPTPAPAPAPAPAAAPPAPAGNGSNPTPGPGAEQAPFAPVAPTPTETEET